MSAYSDWTQDVQAKMTSLGYPAYGSSDWACTTMPVNANSGHAGEPALRLSAQAYTTAYNAQLLPDGGTFMAPSGDSFYVLASAMTGNQDVVYSAPHTMTATERAANALFTGMDSTANVLGLPSLGSISGFLSNIGTQVVTGVLVAVGVGVLLKSRRR